MATDAVGGTRIRVLTRKGIKDSYTLSFPLHHESETETDLPD
jgi:hypothetical protein